MMKPTNFVLFCLIIFSPTAYAAENDADQNALQLTLSSDFYAVPGVEMSIYFDNIVLTQTPDAYHYRVTCDIGNVEKRRWTVTPEEHDVGTHDLSIAVLGPTGKPLSHAATKLHVVAADAGAGRAIRLLIVGDSLTHATQYPNELARLLSLPSNPRWRMLGTHRPKQAHDGVAHEGYGGWTWQRFAAHYEPTPDGTYRKRSSPFVYLAKDGKPRLDVDRYFQEECKAERPDYIIFMLGINDCFGAPPDNPAAIDTQIDTMLGHANVLLDAFRKAVPTAEIGICLTTPPNAREAAFQANYKGRYHRWGWKRIQHRLVQRLIEQFATRQQDNISVIPTQLNLDPIDGYPTNNGVHPNAVGYKQIGASVYAWLKWRLAASAENLSQDPVSKTYDGRPRPPKKRLDALPKQSCYSF